MRRDDYRPELICIIIHSLSISLLLPGEKQIQRRYWYAGNTIAAIKQYNKQDADDNAGSSHQSELTAGTPAVYQLIFK